MGASRALLPLFVSRAVREIWVPAIALVYVCVCLYVCMCVLCVHDPATSFSVDRVLSSLRSFIAVLFYRRSRFRERTCEFPLAVVSSHCLPLISVLRRSPRSFFERYSATPSVRAPRANCADTSSSESVLLGGAVRCAWLTFCLGILVL